MTLKSIFSICIILTTSVITAQTPTAEELVGIHNVPTAAIATITSPLPGMLVYDSSLEQLKVYKNTGTSFQAIGGDNLGNHTATQNINTNGNWLSNGGGNNGVFMTTNGRVGIGLDNPGRELHVNNGGARLDRTSNSAFFMLHRKQADGTPLKTFFFGVDASGVNNGNFFIGDLGNRVGGANAKRILVDTDGDVGIGTDNPNVRLDVIGSIEYTGTIADVSDRRLKKNIEPLPDALEKIKNIDAITYQYRADEFPEYEFSDETQIGLIAQNLETEYPQLVGTNGEGFKNVNYTGLIPVLLKSIQEQQTHIEEQGRILKKQQELIESLSQRITNLEDSTTN